MQILDILSKGSLPVVHLHAQFVVYRIARQVEAPVGRLVFSVVIIIIIIIRYNIVCIVGWVGVWVAGPYPTYPRIISCILE